MSARCVCAAWCVCVRGVCVCVFFGGEIKYFFMGIRALRRGIVTSETTVTSV